MPLMYCSGTFTVAERPDDTWKEAKTVDAPSSLSRLPKLEMERALATGSCLPACQLACLARSCSAQPMSVSMIVDCGDRSNQAPSTKPTPPYFLGGTTRKSTTPSNRTKRTPSPLPLREKCESFLSHSLQNHLMVPRVLVCTP